MNKAEQLWWDGFSDLLIAYQRTEVGTQESTTAMSKLYEFVETGLDHDVFKHSKR